MTKTLTNDQKLLLEEVFEVLDNVFLAGIDAKELGASIEFDPNIGLGIQFGSFFTKRELMKRYGLE